MWSKVANDRSQRIVARTAPTQGGIRKQARHWQSYIPSHGIAQNHSTRDKNSSSASSNHDSSQLQRVEDEQTYVNFTVVEAIDQPFDIAPTQTMLDLFPLMPRLAQDSACIIAAPLHLLRVSASYAFQVCLPKSLNSVVMPCQKVVTLIKATKTSEPVPIGHGYKLVTTDVEDF